MAGNDNDKENTPVEQGGTEGPWVPEAPAIGRLKASILGFNFTAKGSVARQATASAERIIALRPFEPAEAWVSAADRHKSFWNLASQAENEASAKIKIVVEDDDTVCSDFGLDKGKLSESQAKILLNEILDARAARDQRKHDLLLTFASGIVGFVLGLLTRFLG